MIGLQKMARPLFLPLLLAVATMIVVPYAAAQTENQHSYINRENVEDFLDSLENEYNVPRSEARKILAQAQRSDRSLALISKPAERVLEWKDYQKIFVNPQRINEGVKFWKKNARILANVERQIGVPASIIVAIIGVETYYGRQTGGFKVLDALATLGFEYPERSEFFLKELKHFMALVYEQKLDPSELTGSYAGAMGIPQFMPSSYRAYAIDYDGDKKVDIWKNEADAIASVASYFKLHGWKKGEEVVLPAQPTKAIPPEMIPDSLELEGTVKQMKAVGLEVSKALPETTKVLLMDHQGVSGTEYWLGLHNFTVISRYNRSQMYSLAVYQLSKALEKGMSGGA